MYLTHLIYQSTDDDKSVDDSTDWKVAPDEDFKANDPDWEHHVDEDAEETSTVGATPAKSPSTPKSRASFHPQAVRRAPRAWRLPASQDMLNHYDRVYKQSLHATAAAKLSSISARDRPSQVTENYMTWIKVNKITLDDLQELEEFYKSPTGESE